MTPSVISLEGSANRMLVELRWVGGSSVGVLESVWKYEYDDLTCVCYQGEWNQKGAPVDVYNTEIICISRTY